MPNHEECHEDFMARERVNQLRADRDELRRTFNRLPAEDRIPALAVVLKMLSDRERATLLAGQQRTDDKYLDLVRAAVNDVETLTDAVWSEPLHEKVVNRLCLLVGTVVHENVLAPVIEEAEHARKRATKIRESFLASVRANVNLLASMTEKERKQSLRYERNGIRFHEPNEWARIEARALMVETWGEDAVAAALGGGS